jgi:hypothetical protein
MRRVNRPRRLLRERSRAAVCAGRLLIGLLLVAGGGCAAARAGGLVRGPEPAGAADQPRGRGHRGTVRGADRKPEAIGDRVLDRPHLTPQR